MFRFYLVFIWLILPHLRCMDGHSGQKISKNHRRAHAHNFNFITQARQVVGPHQHRIAHARRDWLLQTATHNKRCSGSWEQQSRSIQELRLLLRIIINSAYEKFHECHFDARGSPASCTPYSLVRERANSGWLLSYVWFQVKISIFFYKNTCFSDQYLTNFPTSTLSRFCGFEGGSRRTDESVIPFAFVRFLECFESRWHEVRSNNRYGIQRELSAE